MANPQRRASRARTRTTHTPNTQTTARSTSSVAAAVAADAEEMRGAREIDWASEYAYVFADIRQLLIVSGLLFAGLLVVGFFL